MILLNCEKWYNPHPQPRKEAKRVSILSDLAIQTNRKRPIDQISNG